MNSASVNREVPEEASKATVFGAENRYFLKAVARRYVTDAGGLIEAVRFPKLPNLFRRKRVA